MGYITEAGYKAFEISTIVDIDETGNSSPGYKAFEISTIVDIYCGLLPSRQATKPLKFLLL